MWKDIASFYNPLLRNISGPYDRSYGMDMESYVSVVGVWMRTALDAKTAPLPPISATTDHVPDLWFAPHSQSSAHAFPPTRCAKMKTFEGDHLLRKQITEERVATAWIGRDVIFGGESTNKTKDAGTTTQFHPATVQWRTPSGQIGWIRLVQSPMIDASADEHGTDDLHNRNDSLPHPRKAMGQDKITEKEWDLPGLHVGVDTDAKGFTTEPTEDGIDLIYSDMTSNEVRHQGSSLIADSNT